MDDLFEEHRGYLFGIAYRMLGSVMEAEDIVQEAYLRYQDAPHDQIKSPRAYLSTITTRLCLDQLKSAREQREQYFGPWLPEPLMTENSPAQHMTELESLSTAFLVLLEKLSPLERAVFLLREVFDYEYREIAQIVDKEETTCRQLLSRAKKHVTENRPRFAATPEAQQKILGRFLSVLDSGDMSGLMNLLADEVAVYSDGGGKAQAATRPVFGREAVAKLLLGIRRMGKDDYTVELHEVNGTLAVFMRRIADWHLVNVMQIETDGEHIYTFRNVLNPDKLKHLA